MSLSEKQPLISIITPVYNLENYLVRCLDSILAQTWQNWELLLIDDASTDKSMQICEDYAKRDQRIRLFHQEQQHGAGAARNKALELAQGEYLCFVDGDDWVEPVFCATLYETLVSNHAEIATCGYWENHPQDRLSKLHVPKAEHLIRAPEEALECIHLRQGLTRMLCDKIFARAAMQPYYQPGEVIIGEDYALLLHAIERSHLIAVGTQAMYHYWQREDSACHKGYSEKQASVLQNYKRQTEYLVEKYPALAACVRTHCLNEEMAILSSMTKNGVYDEALIRLIAKDVRGGLGMCLRYAKTPLKTKAAACFCAVDPRLMMAVYKLIYRPNSHFE